MKDGMTADEASFAGDILTAMVSQGHAISNRVEENLRRELEEAENRFTGLFQLVNNANKAVDSARIERILDGYDYDYHRLATKKAAV